MALRTLMTLLGIAVVQASPTLPSRQSITYLTTAQISYYAPYTYYAGAAYCSPSDTLSWSCGEECDSTLGFKPVASGGDGNEIQYWYAGYDPSLGTVIVAHQGTQPQDILSVLTDIDFIQGDLDQSLFPGISSDIKVHDGFRDDHARSASDVLSAVQTAMSQYGTNSVTLVGHSLGAALSLLDSVYLPLHLPSGTVFQTVLYGLPRVGNRAFADYIDSHANLTRINNLKDPIPIMPGRFLGYVHPSGEVHIRETGEWAVCPGQDNTSKECIVGDVPNIFVGDMTNHGGPYDGIQIAPSACARV